MFVEKTAENKDGTTYTYTGADMGPIIDQLKEDGLIEYKFLFKLYSWFASADQKITSGTYELDGRNLKDLSDDDLADIRNRHIGFVFQSFHLLPKMDALENVALPLLYAGVPLKERRERAEEALKAVGLEERIHFLPNQLSGGQCQRVAIARAMVTKPALLLADEPTGALDTKAGNQIMEIFRQLSREGMTIIMITHEQSIADCADKIYYILDGELDTTGRRKEVSADEA
jgi:putative ABC transport system ATP-binding protein